MALLSESDIVSALERLGQLASAQGYTLQMIVVGGAAMVLGYHARQATHDIDVVFLPPPEPQFIRMCAKTVADERGWSEDWLNNAASGYLIGMSTGPILLNAPGIAVRQPATEQLLAMKLCAWRDDVDIADATRLLRELNNRSTREELWQRIASYLLPGRELKAEYAFADLWESEYGQN